MPKKIARDIARQVKQLGEEVVGEFKDLPGGIARETGKQMGMLPRGWGEESTPQISIEEVQKREEEKKKELARWREKKRELEARRKLTEPEKTPEEVERQRRVAEEAKKMKPLEEPEAKKPRGLPLGAKRRVEKHRGTHEIKTGT